MQKEPEKGNRTKSYINEGERRHFIRHSLRIPLKFKVVKETPHEQEEEHATTINISRKGILFPSKKPLEIGSFISIRMPLKGRTFTVKATVVHCAKNPGNGKYDIGACFSDPHEAFQVRLIEQIYLIREYRDLRSRQLGREMRLEEASEEWVKLYSQHFKELYWWKRGRSRLLNNYSFIEEVTYGLWWMQSEEEGQEDSQEKDSKEEKEEIVLFLLF